MTASSQEISQDQKGRVMDMRKKGVRVNVVFAGDKYMQKLNSQFRSEKGTTDVLSFPADDGVEEGVYLLGEIVVNLEQAKRQAEEYEVSEREEIARLITHGALHLLGWDDGDDQSRAEMEEVQEKIIRKLKMQNAKWKI